MDNLIRQIRILKTWVAILTTLVIVLFVIFLIQAGNKGHFQEISAERINVVEKDGKLRMVISNQERQHPGSIGGKELPKRERSAGMIFFNSDGDECGGFTYDGKKGAADMGYSFDQYRNDQIMQLQYTQEGAANPALPGSAGTPPGSTGSAGLPAALKRSYGLKLWDRDDRYPLARMLEITDSLKKLNDSNALNAGFTALRTAGGLGAERLFVGKNTDGEVGLFLRDEKGTPRLKIYINKENQPMIETLDEQGRTINTPLKVGK